MYTPTMGQHSQERVVYVFLKQYGPICGAKLIQDCCYWGTCLHACNSSSILRNFPFCDAVSTLLKNPVRTAWNILQGGVFHIFKGLWQTVTLPLYPSISLSLSLPLFSSRILFSESIFFLASSCRRINVLASCLVSGRQPAF